MGKGKPQNLGDAKKGDKIKMGKDKLRVANIKRTAGGSVRVDLRGQGVRIQGHHNPDEKIN